MEQKKKSFFILLVILAVFTVGAAVFSQNDDMVYENTEETEKEESVASEIIIEKDFFSDFRIGRDQRRDEEKELYESVLKDATRSEEAKNEAETSLEELYRISSMEDRVEEILVGRNYDDALFVVEDTISLLIIRESDLDDAEKESLKDFVSLYVGIPKESISVFTVQ